MSDYYDLGTYSRAITTTSPEAQLWFDRGLIWGFAYNHDESVACYKRALEHDPECAMAYWGIAYSSGCNYNKPWEAFDEADALRSVAAAYDATQQALSRLDGLTSFEQGAHRRAAPSVPVTHSRRGHVALERRLRTGHAQGLRRARRRPRCRDAVRRGDHESHAVAALGPRDRQAGRRCRHRRSHSSAGGGAHPP